MLNKWPLRLLKWKSTGANNENITFSNNVFADWVADRAGGIEKGRTFLTIGAEVYARTLLVRGWPMHIAPQWAQIFLRGAFKKRELPAGVSLRIALHYHPAEIKWDWKTRMRIKRLESSVAAAEKSQGETPDPNEVKALDSIREMQDKTVFGGSSVADIWCYVTVFAESENNLHMACKKIEDSLRSKNFSLSRIPYEQTTGFLQGWLAGHPDLNFQKKYPGRLVDEDAAAALYPCTYGSISEGSGIYIGHRIEDTDKSMCLLDLVGKDPEGNKNFVVVGSSGEGKSTFLKALVNSLLLENYQLFIFDVDGEYREICKKFGGLWIDHTLSSGKYIDPFLIPPPLEEINEEIKRENNARLEGVINGIMRLASLLADGLSPEESNAADRAITRVFDKVGVDQDDPSTFDNCRQARIHDWYRELKDMDNDKGAKNLSEKLWRFFEGAMRRMFQEADNLGTYSSNLVVFHVASSVNKEAEEHAAAVKMSLALSEVWDAVKRNKVSGKRWSAAFCDEGQRLLMDPNASNFTNTLATTIRKWNGLFVLATNRPSVLWDGNGGTEGGSGLWSNSVFKVLFWLEESDMQTVKQNAKLPAEVLEKLSGLAGKRAFIFRHLERGFDALRLELSDEERELVKTRGVQDQ